MVDFSLLETMISSEVQKILGHADYVGLVVIAFFLLVAAFTRMPMEIALVAIIPIFLILIVLGWLPVWALIIFLIVAAFVISTAWNSWGRK